MIQAMSRFPLAKGSSATLHGLLLQVWRAADGATPVGHIAARLGCPADAVWTALDLLDHVGLLATTGAAPLPGSLVAAAPAQG